MGGKDVTGNQDLESVESGVVDIYVARALRDKAQKVYDIIRNRLVALSKAGGEIPVVVAQFGEQKVLKISVTKVKGRKKFNAAHALEKLVEILPPEVYNAHCVSHLIRQRDPGTPVPHGILEDLSRHFIIEKRDWIEESALAALPLSKDEIDSCYLREEDSERLEMPTKLGDDDFRAILGSKGNLSMRVLGAPK